MPFSRRSKSLLGRLRGEQTGFPHLIAADTQEILAAVSAAAECEPAELIAQGPQDVVTVKDRMVAEAMRLIWEQSQGPMTVDHLSRQLPITRRSLERRFRAAVGHGIHDEIVRCRLERAKRLLVGTDLSLKEVASAAGFISADNLGRTFRRARHHAVEISPATPSLSAVGEVRAALAVWGPRHSRRSEESPQHWARSFASLRMTLRFSDKA